jgi:diguanylate cyclase (GGDEF)-like protein
MYFFVLFVLSEIIVVSALTHTKNSKIDDIESRYKKRLQTQLKSVISFYSTTSTIIIDEILNNENIKSILINLNTNNESQQHEVRAQLLNALKPTYDRLTGYGFRQLHFHDKLGNSFLRFHSIENYGDNLFNFRATILEANKTKKPQFGFEEGKILNGFRNVFPIIIDGEFYGTVELSNSFDTFSETLHKNFPLEFKLLITKDYVNSKVFPELINTSTISTFFYEENSTKFNNNRYINKVQLESIDKELKHLNIDYNLQTRQAFVKSLDINDKYYIVTFIPINDFNNTINTYVASYIEDDSIYQEQKSYYILLFFSNVVFISLFMIYMLRYFFDEKNKFMKKAYVDSLTKVYTRAKFNYDISKIIEEYELGYYSFILFDIDHFKNVNDTYGHDVGDMVLEEFSTIIKQTLRENDMIYRWGGEEFIILVKDKNKKHLRLLTEKLRRAITTFQFTKVGFMSSSFGVAISTADDTKDSLLKRADENLYKAKQSGRNCVVMD